MSKDFSEFSSFMATDDFQQLVSDEVKRVFNRYATDDRGVDSEALPTAVVNASFAASSMMLAAYHKWLNS